MATCYAGNEEVLSSGDEPKITKSMLTLLEVGPASSCIILHHPKPAKQLNWPALLSSSKVKIPKVHQSTARLWPQHPTAIPHHPTASGSEFCQQGLSGLSHLWKRSTRVRSSRAFHKRYTLCQCKPAVLKSEIAQRKCRPHEGRVPWNLQPCIIYPVIKPCCPM